MMMHFATALFLIQACSAIEAVVNATETVIIANSSILSTISNSIWYPILFSVIVTIVGSVVVAYFKHVPSTKHHAILPPSPIAEEVESDDMEPDQVESSDVVTDVLPPVSAPESYLRRLRSFRSAHKLVDNKDYGGIVSGFESQARAQREKQQAEMQQMKARNLLASQLETSKDDLELVIREYNKFPKAARSAMNHRLLEMHLFAVKATTLGDSTEDRAHALQIFRTKFAEWHRAGRPTNADRY